MVCSQTATIQPATLIGHDQLLAGLSVLGI
jgi:hypothetical protein